MMAKAGDDYIVSIRMRFFDDIENLTEEMESDAIAAWDFGDFQIAQDMIDISEPQYANRLDMATESAAWQAYQVGKTEVYESEDDVVFDWELDPGAQHCDDCITNSEEGPYTLAELYEERGVPGDAPTECNGGCRCNIVPRRIRMTDGGLRDIKHRERVAA